MAMVSNPTAASSYAIAEDTQQNSNDIQSFAIDIDNPDMTGTFSRQSTLKRTKENEIIQISSDKLTSQIVGTEGDENALNVSGLKGKNIKIFSNKRGKILFFCFSKFSFLFKSLGRPKAVRSTL